MRIASVYEFKAYPPKGGNHLHALQLIRQFQATGHEVLTLGDDTVPGLWALIREFVDIPFQPPGDREISWNSFFASDDLASINQICGDQMRKFGYDANKSS